MPQQRPDSSTTGTRRIWNFSKIWQQSSMLVSGLTVTGGLDMASRTLVCFGFLPVATTRHVMSRSVITPMGFMLSSFSTTGISPQSCFTIISAACCTLCSGVQQAGLALIMSFAFFIGLLLWIVIVFNKNSYFER